MYVCFGGQTDSHAIYRFSLYVGILLRYNISSSKCNSLAKPTLVIRFCAVAMAGVRPQNDGLNRYQLMQMLLNDLDISSGH